MEAELFVKGISPLLKSHGFKKSNATWCKEQAESIAVFNVQKSSSGGGKFYVNIGVYFKVFGNDAAPTENKCHVRVRLEIKEVALVVSEALEWFKAREYLKLARLLAEEDSKKGLVFHAIHATTA